MIAVTRLNGNKVIVNAEHIRYIESTPDTLITFMTGDRVMVQETVEQIVQRSIEYGREIRAWQR